MPKKTKKQKIRAELRKQKETKTIESLVTNIQTPHSVVEEVQNSSHLLSYTLSPKLRSYSSESHSLETSTSLKLHHQLIYSDLKKIVALTIIAISFEAVVYWLIHG